MSVEFLHASADEGSGGKTCKKANLARESSVAESLSASFRRSFSGHHEFEVPNRPVLTYRPKPAFGADGACANALSASTTISSSLTASNKSTISSPLSSPCRKSYESSPTMTWSCPKRSVAVGGSDEPDNPSMSPDNKEGVCKKSTPNLAAPVEKCSSNLAASMEKRSTSNLAAALERGLDGGRLSSWSQYVDCSGESHYETAEKRHTVDMSQLFLGQKFACGMYSRLYRGEYLNQEVAVKIVRMPDEDEAVAKKLARQFHQEVSLLSRLHHVNVVQFVGAMKKPPVFCIITGYLAGGSLRAFLHKIQPNTVAMDQLLAFSLDIAHGMEYLHSQGVLHLDLKSHNLVLGENSCVKVTDFGVARTQSECASMTPDSGTYRWMAPEMISNKTFSMKADVYSFGIILWEMFTGEIPYHDMSTIQAAFAVVDKEVRPPVPANCPRPLKELMEECWATNPDKRPSFYEIVKRLDQFQDCVRRNEAFRYNSCRCEKRSWFRPLLQRLKQSCFAQKQLILDD